MIVIRKKTVLDAPIAVEALTGVTFCAENRGHQFVVSCTRGGMPVPLSGSVSARFVRADGTTILIAGEGAQLVDGNAAITLHQDCYNVPGRFHLYIFNSTDSDTTCIYSCTGTVQRTQVGELIDSGDVVPSLDDIIAKQAELAQDVADASSAIASAQNAVSYLAPVFSTSRTYAVGEYVTKDGALYICTTAVETAGAWDASKWQSVTFGREVTDLKSAVSEAFLYDNIYTGYLAQGMINSSGVINGSASGVAFDKKTAVTKGILFSASIKYGNVRPTLAYIAEFDSNNTLLSRNRVTDKFEWDSNLHIAKISYTVTNDNTMYVQPYFAISRGDFSVSFVSLPMIYYSSNFNIGFPRFLQSYSENIMTSSASELIANDIDNLPNNITIGCSFTSTDILHAPLYPANGRFITFGRRNERGAGDVQLYVDSNGSIFARFYFYSVWSEWNAQDEQLNSYANKLLLQLFPNICISNIINGRLGSNGTITEDNNCLVFADKTPVVNGNIYKISLRGKTINSKYVGVFNDSGVLQNRLMIDSSVVFENVLTGEFGFYYEASMTGFIQPYFIGNSEVDIESYTKPQIIVTDHIPQILLCGDSICRGARNSGKGFGGGLGYPFKNIGVGDSTLSDTHVTPNGDNIPDAFEKETSYTPTIIIADGGINDYFYNSPLGTVSIKPASNQTEAAALNRSTLVGGLEYLFYLMATRYPLAKRVFVITHKTQRTNGTYCPTVENNVGVTQKQIHDTIANVCKLYGVAIADVYENGVIDTCFDGYVSPVAWSEDASEAAKYYVDHDRVHPMALGYNECYLPILRTTLNDVL